MLKRYWLIAYFLMFPSLSFSAPIDIQSNSEGIIITISNLKTDFLNQNGKSIVKFSNVTDREFIGNYNYATDVIKFNLAVPENFQFETKILSINNLGYFDLLTKKEYVPVNQFIPPEKTKLSPETDIKFLGYERGLGIASFVFQPFNYDDQSKMLSIVDKAVIEIKFDKRLNTCPAKITEEESGFYSFVKNQDLVPLLIVNDNKSDKNRDKVLNYYSFWYNPSINYVKLTTHKDGPAVFTADDILASDFSFSNLSVANLHLVFRGNEYPFYVLNDTDGKLNSGDKFIFFGRRAFGDTTWFDNYTDDANFYLYYDNSSAGKRLTLITDSPNPNQIDKVYTKKQFRQEVYYDTGFPQDNIETMPGEGWCWRILTRIPGGDYFSDFNLPVTLNPVGGYQDSVSLRLYYGSSRWDPANSPNHHLKLIFNNDTVDEKDIYARERGFFEINSNRGGFIAGQNIIGTKSVGIMVSPGVYRGPDEVVITHVEEEGTEKPLAINGFANMSFIANSGATVNVPGFRNRYIVAFDTTDGSIYFPSAENGFSVLLGSRKGITPISSAVINDSAVYFSSAPGLVLITSLPANYSAYSINFYNQQSSDPETILGNLPNGSFAALIYNSNDFSLTSKFKDILSGLGSKIAASVDPSQAFVFSCIKGNQTSVTENASVTGISNLSAFLSTANAPSWKAKFQLPPDTVYRLDAFDSLNIQKAFVVPVNKTNLADTKNHADVIIISHKDFLPASYRLQDIHTHTDPALNSMVIDADDIYKEFGYGIKSPHSIKNFLKYTYSNWKKPAPLYITIMGDASYDGRKKYYKTKMVDYIPTYGWPASDYWYVMLDSGNYLPEMILGRIPCKSLDEANKYIDKVETYNTIPNNPWMKNFLLMSGGSNDVERENWYQMNSGSFAQDIILPSPICPSVSFVRKRDVQIGGETESSEIIDNINKGDMWVSYLGHGSPTVFDMDGWQSDRLSNKGKYGFFSTISCNTSDYADVEVVSRNEDYVMKPEKGFIGAGGSSNFSLLLAAENLYSRLITALCDNSIKIFTYAGMLNYARSLNMGDEGQIFISQQYCYLGDPLLRVRNMGFPDLYFLTDGQDIKITSSSNGSVITDEDSTLTLSGNLYNAGFKYYQPSKLILIHKYNNENDTMFLPFNSVCAKMPFSFTEKIKSKPGIHEFTLVADPNFVTQDTARANNYYSFNVNVFTGGLYPLDPLDAWNVSTQKPEFRVVNPIASMTADSFAYSFKIIDLSDKSKPVIYSSKNDEINATEEFIDWKPALSLNKNRNYLFVTKLKDLTIGKESAEMSVPFHSTAASIHDSVEQSVAGIYTLSRLVLKNMELSGECDSAKAVFSSINHPFRVVSLRGNNVRPQRGAEVYYDSAYYVTSPPDDVGFSIVTVSGSDFKVIRNKKYYTWGLDNTMDDSTGVFMNKYLRDSVKTGDYVFITVLGESFRLFMDWNTYQPNSIGSLDSLKSILKGYGSSLSDSLGWGYSFAMFGRKGAAPGSAFEQINSNGDSAEIKGNIIQYFNDGEIQTGVFGPAKSWKNFKTDFVSSLPNECKLLLMAYNNGENDIDSMVTDLSQKKIDLSDKFSGKTYLKAKILLKRYDNSDPGYLSSVKCNFVPADEFALVKSKTHLVSDSVLRGDKAYSVVAIQNISNRVKSDSTSLDLSVNSSGTVDEHILPVLPIDIDNTIEINTSLITDNYSFKNNISLVVNKDNLNKELYSFNNSDNLELNVYPDKIKPVIRLYLDSVEVHNGDFTSVKPKVRIEIFDNSHLPVLQPEKIEVYINGAWQKPSKFEFQSFGSDIPLKAVVRFDSDSLEIGDNIFRIYASDGSGNRDTLIVDVNVSLNAFIENLLCYPNPVIHAAEFSFLFKAPDIGGDANITIYNHLGQKIKSFSQPVIIGLNKVEWDGRDELGNSMPAGFYTFIATVNSQNYVDAVTGKFVIVR